MSLSSGARRQHRHHHHHRRPLLVVAVLLQCVPLFFVAGCLTAVASATRASTILGALLSVSLMMGGFGYLYIGERSRFTSAIFAGAAIWITGLLFNFGFTIGCLDTAEVSSCYREAANAGTLQAVITCTVAIMFVVFCIRDVTQRLPRSRRSRRSELEHDRLAKQRDA
jgi:hypothetical protein